MRRSLAASAVVTLAVVLAALVARPTRAQEPRVLRFEGVAVTLRFEGQGPSVELAKVFAQDTPLTLWRARIPGGWLVSCGQPQVFFVADADHTWDGGSIR